MTPGLLEAKYKLSEAETDEIFFEDIIKKNISQNGIEPVSDPKAIIIEGQPGAGKTSVQKEAEKEFKINDSLNAVICNIDNLRYFHPYGEYLKAHYPNEYPEITGKYANLWKDKLCQYCLEQKLNFIMETTFAYGQTINSIISHIRKNDFTVDLNLIAVPRLISLLGIFERYETQISEEGSGRKVTIEAHDERFNRLLSSIKIAESAKLYNKIKIYARAITIKNSDKEKGLIVLGENPASTTCLFESFFNEMSNPKEWPQKLKTFFEAPYFYTLNLMEKRNAIAEDIQLFTSFFKNAVIHSEINLSEENRHKYRY